MAGRVTIADVARLAGVHQATVSRALNAATESQVNPATAKRIRRVAKEIGYIPNVVARGLRTRLSMTVGVIIPDLTNPIFPLIVRGLEDYLAPRGYTALLANTDRNDATEQRIFDSMMQRHVDGFVFATGHSDHALLAQSRDQGVPVVLVNRGVSDLSFPLITGDDKSGVFAVIEHLATLGHRRILHLAGPVGYSTSEARAEAFVAACAANGVVYAPSVSTDEFSIAAGRRVIDAAIDRNPRDVTAIVAANDLLALGALRAIRGHGLSCPEDISVTGYNDVAFSEDFRPPLTTVRVPYTQMGSEAGRLLLSEIKERSEPPFTITLPVSLVIRESTAKAPVTTAAAR
ncbi:MAG TPA: LacI family DNA-binding transcriptional regulator [Galbitalea sp.]|jgi:LacI family transcriptional regulator|nr:LacI family DNA-binding transcriptional regulator [Galbitalea sp.]